MKAFLKKYWKIITVLAVLNACFVRFTSINRAAGRGGVLTETLVTIVFCVFVNALALWIYWLLLKKKAKIEKIYFIVALLLGFFHIVATPPNYLPDELTHITRVYMISQGEVFVSKDKEVVPGIIDAEMPLEIIESQPKRLENEEFGFNGYASIMRNLFKNSGETARSNYNGAVGYNPIVYAPQIAGMTVANVLHLPPLWSVYIARFFSLVATVVLCYFALKIIPKYKNALLVIMLLPEMLQQSMAISADGLLIGSSFLFVSIVFAAIYGNMKAIGKKSLVALYILATILVLCKKLSYFPILFILFLIPKAKFGSRKRKVIHVAGIMICALAVTGAWMLTQEKTVSTGTTAMSDVLGAPITFLVRTIGTFFGAGMNEYYGESVGAFLDFDRVGIMADVYLFGIIILFTLLMERSREKFVIKPLERASYILAPAAIIVFIHFVAMTQWELTSQDNPAYIFGFCGRYLLPLFIFLPFIFHSNSSKKSAKVLSPDYIFIVLIAFNAIVLAAKVINNIF